MLSKRYKFRVRENEVNLHFITEEHYERYLNQEVQYRKETRLCSCLPELRESVHITFH